MSPRPHPGRRRGSLAAWGALLVVTLLVGELFRLPSGELLVAPAGGVALAWLAPRRFDRDVAFDGLLLLGLTVLVGALVGMTWPEAVGAASSLLVQTTVGVVVIAWLAPSLWSGQRLDKLRVGDLWTVVGGAAVGAALGGAVGALWTVGDGEWWDISLLVTSAAGLLGVALVGTCALVMHHQVFRVPGSSSRRAALLGAMGVRAEIWWWAEVTGLYVATVLTYLLIFAVSWGTSLAFVAVLLAVYVGLCHTPLFKTLHAAVVLGVVTVAFDPFARIWVGIEDQALSTGLVQLLLFSVLASGLTISILTEERRSWAARLVDAERRTRDQMGLVRGVLDRLEDAVAVYAVDRAAPIYQNSAGMALVGGTAGAGLTLTRPDGRLLTVAEMPFTRVLAGEQINGEEYVLRSIGSPEGRTVILSGTPWEGRWPEGHRRAIVVAHDVTALQRQRDELEAFVGTVAHDLRNPVTVVQGWAEQIREEPDVADLDNPLLHTGLERISSVAERMQQLISGLLAWSTAQGRTVVPQPVDLREMVGDVCHSHREASSAEQAPRFDIGRLPVVHGDPLLLRQVLDNLVGNAVKYVAPGVVPHVQVSAGLPDQGWVTLFVADNGIGIPVDLQREVFQGFFRVSEQQFAGTGLGLRICRTIVERHGGSIAVEDQPRGSGTIFVVTLPAEARTAELAVEEYASTHSA